MPFTLNITNKYFIVSLQPSTTNNNNFFVLKKQLLNNSLLWVSHLELQAKIRMVDPDLRIPCESDSNQRNGLGSNYTEKTFNN